MIKKQGTILIVDDNRNILTTVRMLLEPIFDGIITIANPNSIPAKLREEHPDVVLLDMNFSSGINSGNEGLYWLREIKSLSPKTEVVLFTAYADIQLAVTGIKEGAADFIVKPFENEKMIRTLVEARDKNRAVDNVINRKGGKPGGKDAQSAMYWGDSDVMNNLRSIVEKVAATDANILITGENGTGKEVLANEIHRLSTRCGKKMLPVDMGAITETLFESELFGHVKGAFTDAKVDKPVKFELSPLACAYARARGADRMCSYGDFVALSDVCDEATALLIKREVSDGVIAPGYTPEAIEVLKEKRKGTYCVIKIDPDYVPAPIEHKQVFGVTFEQGRNEVKLDDPALFEDVPTKNKTFTPEAKRDLIISLITLKYTQSNSVCYVKDGQAIGIGAGQQSRIHCTRLAGSKADEWWLRQCPKVMNLPFKEKIRRADRDNTINVYISDEWEDVLQDGVWEQFFTEKPEPLTREEKKAWIAQNKGVSVGSDAFFPFGDNIERAHKSGVEYIAEAGGSIRDDHVIDTCDKYGIAMAFTHVRLFHH